MTFLIVRDVFLTLFPIAELFILSDLILFSGYFYFLKEYTGNKGYDNIVLSLVITYALILLVQSGFPIYSAEIQRFQRLPALLYAVFIGSAFLGRGRKRELIKKVSPYMALFLLLYNMLLFALGELNPISQTLVVPSFYLLPLIVFHFYSLYVDAENRQRTDTLAQEIDSLFGFMRNIGSAIT